MPQTQADISHIEQARLIDSLVSATIDLNGGRGQKDMLTLFTFDEETKTQKEYIVCHKLGATAEQVSLGFGTDGKWAVVIAGGDADMEKNYISACKMTGAIPDGYDKVALIRPSAFVHPGDDRVDRWLESKGMFIVYYHDYADYTFDALSQVSDYIVCPKGLYHNVVFLPSCDEERCDMDRIRRFWGMIPDGCRTRLYSFIATSLKERLTSRLWSLYPKQEGKDIHGVLSFGRVPEWSLPGRGFDLNSDEVIMVPPPEPGSSEAKALAAGWEMHAWSFAWLSSLRNIGLKPDPRQSGLISGWDVRLQELGRAIGVPEKFEEIMSRDEMRFADMGVSYEFSTWLPTFDHIYGAVERPLTDESTTSLADIVEDLERSGCAVGGFGYFALFTEGMAVQVADDDPNWELSRCGSGLRDVKFPDMRSGGGRICFALLDDKTCLRMALQYATAYALVANDPDQGYDWMAVALVEPGEDFDHAALREASRRHGVVIRDDLAAIEFDEISGLYNVDADTGELSLAKDAHVINDTALAAVQYSKWVSEMLDEKGGRLSDRGFRGGLDEVVGSMADIATFSKESGDRIRNSWRDVPFPHEVCGCLMNVLDNGVKVDRPEWMDDVRFAIDAYGLWNARLAEIGLTIMRDDDPFGMDSIDLEALWAAGRVLGIDGDLDVFRQGVPVDDIVA